MVLLLSTEEHSASRVFTKLGIYTKRAVSNILFCRLTTELDGKYAPGCCIE